MNLALFILAVVALWGGGFLIGASTARTYRRRWRAALAIIEKLQPELDELERAERLAAIRKIGKPPFGPRPRHQTDPHMRALLKEVRRKGEAA